MNDLNESNNFMGFFKLIYVFLIFLIILGVSYYFSKFIGKKFAGKNKLMKHIETISFGSDKCLHIVQICDEFYLLSSSQKGMYLLEKLPLNIIKSSSCYVNDKFEYENYDNYLNKTFDNINIDNNKNGIKQSINKLRKIVRGNKTDE